jgi:tetratricopeptide (TPR) repeat protein
VDGCPDEDALQRFVEGSANELQRSQIETHVGRCSSCGGVIAHLAAGLAPVSGSPVGALGPLAAGDRVGRYLVIERIGSGGMGAVYAAYDAQLDRKVALKILRDGGRGLERWLVREAQTMARLDHTNVVPVYDVGEDAGRVYVAMAFVQGQTLRAWLREPRTWREIRDAFLAAGAGLAAAHGAGIIHCDFKPDNVLINAKNHVRVTDFGLARAPVVPSIAPGSGDATGTITRIGEVNGTPAYMAPEQIAGHKVDERTDLFAFCVALWEALYGQKPFGGDTLEERGGAIARGELREPPAARGVPRWLRAIVESGLSASPDDRPGSMTALLERLRRDPSRRWWRVAAALAALGIAGGGLAFAPRRGTTASLCGGAATHLLGVWDDASRARVRAALSHAQRPPGDVALVTIERELDRYRYEWILGHEAACRATRITGEQSEAVLDQRMRCLDDRLQQLHALVDEVIAVPDLDKAVEAASALPPIAACGELVRLSEGAAPPAPGLTATINRLEDRLSRVRLAIDFLGASPDNMASATAVLADAERAGYAPTIGRARRLIADAQRTTDPKAALAMLHRAALDLERGGATEELVLTRLHIASILGWDLRDLDAALVWASYAETAIDRLGRPPDLMAQLAYVRGAIYFRAHKIPLALEQHWISLTYEERVGPDVHDTALTLNALALDLAELGRLREAMGMLRRALEIARHTFGPNHMDSLNTLDNIGQAEAYLGQLDDAERDLRAAVEGLSLGPATATSNHADACQNLASVLLRKGDHLEEAESLIDRSIADLTALEGPDTDALASVLPVAAQIQLALGHRDRAVELSDRALALATRRDAHHPELRRILRMRGDDERKAVGCAAAAPWYARSIAEYQATSSTDEPEFAYTLDGAGRCAAMAGQLDEALALLHQAVEVATGKDGPMLSESQSLLALVQELASSHASADEIRERISRF